MHIENLSDDLDNLPFILVKDEAVIKISREFSDIVEFTCDELLNSRIEDVFKILRIDSKLYEKGIDGEVNCFLFTKSLEVKAINIRIINLVKEKLYIFQERPGSNLDVKFPLASALCSDNYNGIAIFSMPDMKLLKANEKYISFFDEPYNKKENCIGRHIFEFATGYTGSTFEEICNTVIKTGKTYNVDEYKYDRLSRGVTYWKLSIITLSDENKIAYCVMMTTEITEQVLYRKKIEEQARIIKEQKEELEAIIENMSDNLMVFDKDGNYILNNRSVLGNMKADTYMKVGDSYKPGIFFDLEGNEIPLAQIPSMRVLKGERIIEQVMHIRDGEIDTYAGVSGTPLYDSCGNFRMGILCTRDITEEEKQIRIIRQQKELLEAIVDTMQESLYVINKKGDHIITNKAAREQLLASVNSIEESYKAAKIYDLNGKELAFTETCAYRVLNGETVENKVLCYVINGEKYYIIVSGTPVFDEEGNLTYAVLSTRDITDIIHNQEVLKSIQEKLLIAERERRETLEKALEMKDEFLSLISHEFRTPLNVINTAIQAMNYICGDELSDRAKKYLSMIRVNTFRQLRLVNNLLDITRANAGRIKIAKKNIDIVFLTRAIAESVQTYASQKGINVIFVSSLEKKIIGIDDEKYERILLNLLSNAIKFTPGGRSVTVKLLSKRKNICLEVSDNGIGIPADKLEVIFERFGQVDSSLSRQAEGTGIGLSLVKRFVEALGGSISVKSKAGKGSTFTILLPDETVDEEQNEKEMIDLLDNRLIQSTKVEFSDIYI